MPLTPQEEAEIKKSKKYIAIGTAIATFVVVGGCEEWRHNLHDTNMILNMRPDGQPNELGLKPHGARAYHRYKIYHHNNERYYLEDPSKVKE